ncbi:class IV adenylate cyclase [Panacibacter ginsenosidivorans]|uniref:Class IV adenylate cyclase n=1 Tax=Panacibacter ginsenosidivorans TaxID=1813871 RepID=A0A5B8VDT6_9BACT|nr:class IV adenylate cyclase [Panacibacter ginsenosidivorans]QEC68448.1 class IV adenylate cyclase [Panacibacter ginsenosidivorans]
MKHINIEIKAKCFHPKKVEAFLVSANAVFKGTDLQKDTYFNVSDGRLKLRQGNIENNLIFYNRNNQKGPKQSDFQLVAVSKAGELETLLIEALGVKVIVEKKRKIFFLDNIKIHLDEVPKLGSFVEIEASNLSNPSLTVEHLHQQCADLMQQFDVKYEDLIEHSYSDMLMGL